MIVLVNYGVTNINYENLDVAIVGGVWGTGKRAGWIGSLILGIRDADTDEFKEIGMMGTGIKEKKNEKEDVTFEDGLFSSIAFSIKAMVVIRRTYFTQRQFSRKIKQNKGCFV